MADIKKHIYLRDTRDRLIDALGFGETLPLRDLPVGKEQLIAPKGATAGIPIDASQRDCTYALWEREREKAVERSPSDPADEPGTGASIVLESPVIVKDVGYRIRSTRDGFPERWVYLKDLADVKTGINAELQAEVLSGTRLDPTLDTYTPGDVRVVPYGTRVEVAIRFSQKGVSYRLVRAPGGATISESDVPGSFLPIKLTTAPMFVDTNIGIHILQTIAGQPNPEETTADIVLPVVVAPNLESSVHVKGTHILDYAAAATIVIRGTQVDVHYELYGRRLDASDFVPALEDTTVDVNGAAADVYTVKRPPDAPRWELLPGFSSRSASIVGNGADLEIPAGTFDEDTLIQVRAIKTKTLPSGHEVTLSVPLKQVAVLLVRPNPAPRLHFQVLWTNGATTGALRMTGGQRGVSYHLSQSAGGADLGSAGYFFDRYGASPEKNAGVGLLRIGRDFVVGRDPWTDLVIPELRGVESLAVEVDLAFTGVYEGFDSLTAEQRETLLPELPIVDTARLASGTTLHGLAVKPRTALSAALTQTATITSVPAISTQLDEPGGRITAVVVAASRAGETYSLRVNGVAQGSAMAGNGQTLTFVVDAAAGDRIFEVTVSRGAEPAIVVEEIVRFVEAGAPVAAV